MAFLPVYNGSHFVSSLVRSLLDTYGIQKIKKWFGYQLATATFVFAVTPLGSASGILETVPSVVPDPIINSEAIKTETTFIWPVTDPTLTQGYRAGHPGIDIQGAPPIFPIDDGVVSDVIASSWGYGKHVIVIHPNGRSSLYGHMSKINVEKGQNVTRDTILGIMGRTGFATGIHLHLEIYQEGKTINPLSILPMK